MKWLITLVLALSMATPAFAGEDPYIAIVGNDKDFKPWYVSEKYRQFMYDQEAWQIPVCASDGCESFETQRAINAPEVCYFNDNGEPPPRELVWPNSLTTAGNSGWYKWWVRLPKKPSGQINLVLQCGVLKPNSFPFWEYESIELCAAETGERIGHGTCVRDEVNPGWNPLVVGALPRIKAIAYPGPYNSFTPFHLTAFKNPGSYNPFGSNGSGDKMVNGEGAQILDGSANAKILLKACMDKTVVAKLPVTGQINAANEEETDLEAGDFILVRIDIPRDNTVDVFCHRQSLKVMGIGEAPQLFFPDFPNAD